MSDTTLRATLAEALKSLQWSERYLRGLVTEDDGNGAFVRGQPVELVGFGAGMEALRKSIRDLDALVPVVEQLLAAQQEELRTRTLQRDAFFNGREILKTQVAELESTLATRTRERDEARRFVETFCAIRNVTPEQTAAVLAGEWANYQQIKAEFVEVAPYLKDGETVPELVERHRKDIDALLTIHRKALKRAEQAEAALAQMRKERDTLKKDLEAWRDWAHKEMQARAEAGKDPIQPPTATLDLVCTVCRQSLDKPHRDDCVFAPKEFVDPNPTPVFKPRYSGGLSQAFWDAVNARDDDSLFVVGCALQDLEGRVLQLLNDSCPTIAASSS